MSNIEFISAKDLPVSEAEEVDVLCVENGELKRKEGASLGGGNYDAKVKIWIEFDADNNEQLQCELVEGSYNALVEKIDNELVATVLVVTDTMNSMENQCKGVTTCQPTIDVFDGDTVLWVRDITTDLWFAINSDNTMFID